jgi:hypothetical protein
MCGSPKVQLEGLVSRIPGRGYAHKGNADKSGAGAPVDGGVGGLRGGRRSGEEFEEAKDRERRLADAASRFLISITRVRGRRRQPIKARRGCS